ncbi:MAG: YdcF family protein [Pyrinomonadaceae bacterium]
MATVDTTRRGHVRARRLALFVAIALAAWPFAAWAAARWLVVGCDLERADAVVVLSGSSTYRERARRAAEIYALGRAPLVVLTNDGQKSGWSVEAQRNPLFFEREAEELTRRGVPAERIRVIEGEVASTYEEARRVREFAEANNLRSVIVVTAPYQTRRALWVMRRVSRDGALRVAVDAPAPGDESPRAALWWWHALGWRLVPGEYLKLAYYVTRY